MKVLLIMADANMHKFWLFGRLKSAPQSASHADDAGGHRWRRSGHRVSPGRRERRRVPLDWPADPGGHQRADRHVAPGLRAGRSLPQPRHPCRARRRARDDSARRSRPHADALVVGMAGKTWPRLLADFRAGKMRGCIATNRRPATRSPACPRPATTCSATAAT